MKKIILFAALSLVITTAFAQKKKSSKSAKAVTALAKTDNLVAEVKAGNFQLTVDGKETIVVKPVDSKFSPTDVKLTSFTAGGTKLYLLCWTEKTQSKTDFKLEDTTIIYSNIYEIASKKQVFANSQSTTNITEKVFLDALKQVSETQQKIRREGFEFILNPDGSVTQRSKKQENKLVYDAVKMEYVDAKRKK